MEQNSILTVSLEEFASRGGCAVPELFDSFLTDVSRSGATGAPWQLLRPVMRAKLMSVVDEVSSDENYDIDPAQLSESRSAVLSAFDSFSDAPFTIQRLCEVLVKPSRYYTRVDKLMRGLLKCLSVVSCVDQQGRKIVEDIESSAGDSETNNEFVGPSEQRQRVNSGSASPSVDRAEFKTAGCSDSDMSPHSPMAPPLSPVPRVRSPGVKLHTNVHSLPGEFSPRPDTMQTAVNGNKRRRLLEPDSDRPSLVTAMQLESKAHTEESSSNYPLSVVTSESSSTIDSAPNNPDNKISEGGCATDMHSKILDSSTSTSYSKEQPIGVHKITHIVPDQLAQDQMASNNVISSEDFSRPSSDEIPLNVEEESSFAAKEQEFNKNVATITQKNEGNQSELATPDDNIQECTDTSQEATATTLNQPKQSKADQPAADQVQSVNDNAGNEETPFNGDSHSPVNIDQSPEQLTEQSELLNTDAANDINHDMCGTLPSTTKQNETIETQAESNELDTEDNMQSCAENPTNTTKQSTTEIAATSAAVNVTEEMELDSSD